jgi:hypothetical protein
MGRKTHQNRTRYNNIRAIVSQTSIVLQNVLQFAFSILINGGSFSQIANVMLHNGILPPGESTFYRVSKRVFDTLGAMAIDSMREYRRSMWNNETISIDGSWSHRRQAAQCAVSVVSSLRNKVIDCEIIEKKTTGLPGNFEGSSKNMEMVGVQRLIERWDQENFQFLSYCHDNDGATRNVFRTMRPNVTEYLDRGHLVKSFKKLFTKFNKKNILRGLQKRLVSWLFIVLQRDDNCSVKEALWLGAVDHYTNKTQNPKAYKWPMAKNPTAVATLDGLLHASLFIIQKCTVHASTQMNECFHSIKAHFANKLLNWNGSFACRIFASILQTNSVHYWVFEARRRLGLPQLSLDILTRLLSTIARKIQKQVAKKARAVIDSVRRSGRRSVMDKLDQKAIGYGLN